MSHIFLCIAIVWLALLWADAAEDRNKCRADQPKPAVHQPLQKTT
jgi:hypothetical protein